MPDTRRRSVDTKCVAQTQTAVIETGRGEKHTPLVTHRGRGAQQVTAQRTVISNKTMTTSNESQDSTCSPNAPDLENCYNHSSPSSLTLLLVGYSLLMPVGVLLNGVSLYVFIRFMRPLSVVGIFLCNLALSDLLFSLSLPLRIYYYANHHWPFGSFLCSLAGSIFHINMYGSCLFLLCINVDRYLAIVHPLRFRHLRRRKVARLTCVAVWLMIIGGSVPAAVVHTSSDCLLDGLQVSRCFEAFNMWDKAVLPLLVVAEVLGFLLPLTAVLYCSCHVFVELCRAQEIGQGRHGKTIKLLCLNLAIFLFCFVPYNTTLVGYGLLRAKLVEDTWNIKPTLKKIISVTVLFASTNCALDPLIYYFSTEGFRRTLSRMSGQKKPKPIASQETKWTSSNDSSIKPSPRTISRATEDSKLKTNETNAKVGKKLIEESEI
ncbi:lysophosphatidic acid receptor 5 [Xenopus laevis]|uniref:Lysophosphatidic acid receptor 5 n=2 Tax=Xenopus laevis TaxID=8355 RepID=A0A1L8FIP6_XENLA|nr:lysophosphatidic acid receptor 5 [Xenopus laevis]OCT71444.1 hypothetical protein XELAEV_18034424mg [Xenopus laevis]